MYPYIISILMQLNGFGASSGMVHHNNQIYLVSDDSDYLFHFSVIDKKMQQIPLIENAQLQHKKKQKMDLEAIATKGNKVYLLGSGSKENRRNWIVFNRKNQKIQRFDYSGLIGEMVSKSGIPEKEINFEGLIIKGKTAYLFNRGNGKGNHNGIFEIQLKNQQLHKIVRYQSIELPDINGEKSGFSDAILKDGKIYFLATGERTENSFKDGEIAGTFFGVMNPENFKIITTFKISDHQKFEGISFRKIEEGKLTFYLCEDSDNGAQKSDIYELQTGNIK